MAIRDNDFSMFDNVEDSGGDMASQYDELTRFVNSGSNKKTKEDPARDAVITALAKQILAQGRSGQWKGEGLGSAEANARKMAEIMADTGITDIKQFGQFTKEIPTYTTDDSGNSIQDGTQTITTYGNKETGKEVANTYSERQTGNAFGGTFAGEGNTGYRVNFDAQGNPIFYTTEASSNDLAALMQDAGPVFQIGLALATGGLSIPQQIAARLAVNVLSGQDVGDAIKGAAISMAVVNIPGMDFMKEGGTFIKGLNLGEAVTNTLTNSFQNAVTSGATAALTGKSVGDAMVTGAISGGVNGAVGALLNSADMKELTKDLSATEKRLVSNAVSGVISGKPLDQILINSAIAAANAEINNVKNPPSTAGVDKTTIGDFDDTEVTRLTKLGYTKDQIKEYFGRLETLTGAFDDPQEPIPVKNTSDDVVEKLKSAGLTQSSNAEQLASVTRSINQSSSGTPAVTGNKEAEDNEVLINAQLKAKADEEAAARAEQERLARETQQAKKEAQEKANKLALEAKNIKDLETARKAQEDADRLTKEDNDARIAKEANDARIAKEAKDKADNEVLITAKAKADAEAAARATAEAKRAEEEQLARETQQAAEAARKTKEAKDANDARIAKEAKEAKEAKDADDFRKAKEAKEAKDKADNEVLITAKAKADAEAAARATAEAKKVEEEEQLAREAQEAARQAQEAKDAEIERQAETDRQRVSREAQQAAEARKAKEDEIFITAKKQADAEAARIAAEKAEKERLEQLAREAQQATRSLVDDPIKGLEDSGLKYSPAKDEVLITAKKKAEEEAARIANEARRAEEERLAREAQQTAITPKKLEEVLVEDKKLTPEQPIPSPIDDYFKTIPKDIDILEIIGNRPVNYLPTDDDFPATPIPTTPGVIPTPKIPTPTVAKPAIPPVKPATPAASPSMDLNGLLALLSGQQQPAQQAPMQDPYAHIKLMEELFGPTINLTPAGENTTQRK